jgi:hypothetical protein
MKKLLVLLVVLAISMFGVSAAFAYDVKVDEDTFAKVGLKAQIWYQNLDKAAPNGSDSSDFSIKQVRLYTSGQITNLMKFGANVDFGKGSSDKLTVTDTAGTAAVTDAWITLDFMKEAKLMVGIYRMAVSRVALQDSYTYLTVHSPAVAAARYLSNENNYRSAGATLWGDVANGMIRYNVSLWDGNNSPVTAVPVVAPANTLATINSPDRPAYSARVAVNLWDPEPGYTNACCYLGKSKLLSFGAGYLSQGISGSAGSGSYTVKTVDAYLAMDPITAEAGYFIYDYDTLGTAAVGTKPVGYYAQAGFKIGQIEPAVRYEKWDADNATNLNNYKRYVAAVNYYLDGHNAKITLERMAQISDGIVSGVNRSTPDNTQSFVDWTLQLGVQF